MVGLDKPAVAGQPAVAPAASPALPRKIIYNSTLDLVAEDVGKAQDDLRRLITEYKGYISSGELRGVAGTHREGHWTIRIPVEQFDAFRTALLKLGEVRRDSIDSQDVTDQFYDLEARIKTNKAEEESLLKLLTQTTNHDQILALRRELNRLRGELEVQQGQLQRLDKLSTLATFTITIYERRSYVPEEAPAFGTRVGRTFGDSLTALRTFGEFLVLFTVAVAPWLPLALVVVGPLWLLRRRARAVPIVIEHTPAATDASA